MTFTRLIFFWIYSAILYIPLADAQQIVLPVNDWIQKLSVKNDPKGKIFTSVMEEISNLDTVSICDALHALNSERASAGKLYLIRSGLLINQLSLSLQYCSLHKDWLSETKKIELLAYEVNDPFLIMMSHRMLASDYEVLNEFGISSYYLQLTLNHPFSQYAPNLNKTFNEYLLGDLLYNSREYQNALFHLRQVPALNYLAGRESRDSLENYTWMFYWNTVGLCYEKLTLYDSSLYAFDKALFYARLRKDAAWTGLVQGNRGQIFLLQEKYDSAETLLKLDIQASIIDSQHFAENAANSLQLLSRIYIKRGQPVQAVQMLNRGQQLLKLLPNQDVEARLSQAYMLAYEKLNRADSVLFYARRYTILHDSIEGKAANNRDDLVKLRLENTQNIYQIEILRKESHRINLIRNFSIVLTLLAGAMSYLYLNRQRLKMRIRQQQMLDARDAAERESREAKSKLDVFTERLLEKNILVETLQTQLNQKVVDSEQHHFISQLSQHTILTDEDWEKFRHLFEKVYPGFFHNLKIKVPDITLAEQRMAALTKLRLSSKEASHLLGISHASASKTKLRLRNRLVLDTDAELDTYLA